MVVVPVSSVTVLKSDRHQALCACAWRGETGSVAVELVGAVVTVVVAITDRPLTHTVPVSAVEVAGTARGVYMRAPQQALLPRHAPNPANCCTTVGTSCTTNPQQVDVVKLDVTVDRHVINYVCPVTTHRPSYIGVVNKLNRADVFC